MTKAIHLVIASLAAAGCTTDIAASDHDAQGGHGKADSFAQTVDPSQVVDCTSAKDSVVVRTCTFGTTDSCSVQGALQATQVVKNTAVVAPITGVPATYDGKAIYKLDAAEAKLLADLHAMHLLLGTAGAPAASAFEYTADGAPFVYADPIAGVSLVTKTSANDSIARASAALSAASPSCTGFRVASTDGITPVSLSFICEQTASDTLLACDGSEPGGLDYAFGPSTIVAGVELDFSTAGCGAFHYDLINRGTTPVTVESSITGVQLQPSCNFNVAAGGGAGHCDAADIAGPVTVTYAGTITRGTTRTTFSLPVSVRCTSL